MKVLITGATGFIGAHTAVAAQQAGHDIKLLVRDPAKAQRVAHAIGLGPHDVAQGDVTEVASIERALAGCDAVIHAAGAVSLDRRKAAQTMAVNEMGARHVLATACDLGAERVVYVSSVAALAPAPGLPISLSSPIAEGAAYGASKAAAEVVARDLQERGAPVHITYPGGVIGPAAGEALGEVSGEMARFVASGILPTREGALPIVDVRDVAAIHIALLQPGDRPSRVICGGTSVSMHELSRHLSELTGRRFPVLPLSGSALRALGRFADLVAGVLPVTLPLSEEAMAMITNWRGTIDNAAELGVTYRDVRTTLADAIVAWYEAGLLSRPKAGALVDGATAVRPT